MLKESGLLYTPDRVIVSAGAKSSLYIAMLSLLDAGDEVLIPSPYWLTYPELVKVCGAKPVFIDTKQDGYRLTGKAFGQAITSKTKMLILNSPCNPTGVVYTRAELEDIARVAVKNDVCVLSDEIYENLVYDGKKHVSIASVSEEMKKLTVVVSGMSKSYAMTGWRVGYACAEKHIVAAMNSLQSHLTGNVCSIAQYASVAALNDGEQFTAEARALFERRKNLAVDLAKTLPSTTFCEPEGAFYILIDVSAHFGKKYGNKPVIGSISFAEALLDEGVAVIPCLPFGDDDTIRISYAVGEDAIKEGFARIGAFIEKLK
ncbi:MAG: pyridoxal phosphate-dependent aminotransferase, partial [Clostridia bacterium]|nr:pyridoxal phosphate-dependent aminotransferase [Clostridia bacterium]